MRVPKAYPYYDFSYKANVDTIRKWIETEAPNIHPVGRNGMHKYNNQDHSMYTAMLTVENMYGADHDIWSVNVEEEYHEAGSTGRDAPVLPRPHKRHGRHARHWLSTRATTARVRRWRPWMTLAAAGLLYLALGFVLWVHAWAEGATTHTLCGCGDPALFLWFFQWPATALAHGQNPFFSTALFHPTGINLLAQTSVTGLSLPLVPVTWIWGPVASLNVASTIAPALTAFTAFVVIRRWAPWTPAAFVGGLLYGFSPFVLSSLEFAHLMTAALMLLPLILAVLDEILIRQRHGALGAGVLLGLLLFGQFFLSSELLAIAAVVVVICLRGTGGRRAGHRTRRGCGRALPHAVGSAGPSGSARAAVLLAWPVWFALEGPAHLPGLVWPNVGVIGGFIPSSFVTTGYPLRAPFLPAAQRVRGRPAGLLGLYRVELPGRHGRRAGGVLAGPPPVVLRLRLRRLRGLLAGRAPRASGSRPGSSARIPVVENVIEQRFMAIGFLAAAVILAIILERVHRAVPDWRGALGALARERGRPRADGRHLRRAPALHHAGGRPAPLVQRGGADPARRGGSSSRIPAPFSGIQSAMAWQAVNGMHYSQAGGGGPQGVERRAGTAAPGFDVLSALSLGAGGTSARRHPGPTRRGPPRPLGLAGEHRGGRARSPPSRRASWGGTPSTRPPS